MIRSIYVYIYALLLLLLYHRRPSFRFMCTCVLVYTSAVYTTYGRIYILRIYLLYICIRACTPPALHCCCSTRYEVLSILRSVILVSYVDGTNHETAVAQTKQRAAMGIRTRTPAADCCCTSTFRHFPSVATRPVCTFICAAVKRQHSTTSSSAQQQHTYKYMRDVGSHSRVAEGEGEGTAALVVLLLCDTIPGTAVQENSIILV